MYVVTHHLHGLHTISSSNEVPLIGARYPFGERLPLLSGSRMAWHRLLQAVSSFMISPYVQRTSLIR